MERVPKHDTYIPQRPRIATWICQPDINRLDLSTLVCYSIGDPRQMLWLLQFIVHPDVIITVNDLTFDPSIGAEGYIGRPLFYKIPSF